MRETVRSAWLCLFCGRAGVARNASMDPEMVTRAAYVQHSRRIHHGRRNCGAPIEAIEVFVGDANYVDLAQSLRDRGLLT